MVITPVDYRLFLYFRTSNIIYQGPTDTTATSGIYKTVLRTGIQRILSIHKFRMKNHIPLLASCFQIRQTLPSLQILGAGNSCRSGSRGKISRRCRIIMTFSTENTINPSVFMSRQAHIINICRRNNVLRHSHGIIPKTEIIYAVRTFSHCEERFTIRSFNTHHQQIFTIPFDSSRI